MAEITRYETLPPPRRHTSTRLALVTWYFRASAVLGGVALALGKSAAFVANPVGWTIAAVMVAGWWHTASLLASHRWLGLWLALGTLALPLLRWAVGAGTGTFDLALAAIGTGLALSTWRELR